MKKNRYRLVAGSVRWARTSVLPKRSTAVLNTNIDSSKR